MQVPRYFAFSRGPMVNQLCTEVVGFVMHHLADAVPSEATTLWFLVMSGSVQLACSLAMRMPVPISVVLGLPTEQEPFADVGTLACSNLRIADGLSSISWNAVFENFAEGCPVDCSCVPEKAEGEQESSDEVEDVGATLDNALYCTPKQARGPSKKVVSHARETRTKPVHPRQKAKAAKKPMHHLLMSLQLRDPILSRLLPRGPRLGLRHHMYHRCPAQNIERETNIVRLPVAILGNLYRRACDMLRSVAWKFSKTFGKMLGSFGSQIGPPKRNRYR